MPTDEEAKKETLHLPVGNGGIWYATSGHVGSDTHLYPPWLLIRLLEPMMLLFTLMGVLGGYTAARKRARFSMAMKEDGRQ